MEGTKFVNNDLLRFKKDTIFGILDFETEDTNIRYTQPWQAAFILATQNEILEKHDIMIKWPNLNMSKGAEQITGFDRLRWERQGIEPLKAMTKINSLIEKSDYIGGHNIISFDMAVYVNSCRSLKLPVIPWARKAIDTFPLFKGYRLEMPYRRGENLLAYQMRMNSIIIRKRGFATLSAAAKEFGIEFDASRLHDALYDITINRDVINQMLYKLEI